MKITKDQLREMIREAIHSQLNEDFGTKERVKTLQRLVDQMSMMKDVAKGALVDEKDLMSVEQKLDSVIGTLSRNLDAASASSYGQFMRHESMNEKWGKDVKVEKTGEHSGQSVEQIRKRLSALKKKEDKSEAEKKEQDELVFALRAKTGWKKGKGATK